MVMRRCPARSMTIVGDVAQTGDVAGTASWSDALGPFVGDRWRLAPLTVNYRTPAEIMTVAADVLGQIDPEASPPRSVRESGAAPWRLNVADAAGLAGVTAEAAAGLAAQAEEGTLAVIVPDGRLAEIGAAVRKTLPDAGVGDADADGPDLERPVVVLTVRQAKGLEFDAVLVADPGMILTESPLGLGDLYVALTRATQRAGVVHTGPPSRMLAGLTEVTTVADGLGLSAGRSIVPDTEVA
jgi:hypothetical protein